MSDPTMHSLLRRQIKRHFGEGAGIPPAWREFVEVINKAYQQFDTDRGMLERSLEMSSQELLQANSEMRALFQAIPDLLFRLDHQGTILDFKAGSTSDLMLRTGEMFGKRIQDVPPKHVGEQFRQAIHRVIEKKSLVSTEYSLPIHGQECQYEARLVPLLENQIFVIVRNITERKRAEEQLRQAVSVLQSTIESTADGILVVNSTGKIVSVNGRFARMWHIPQHLIDARVDAAVLACGTSQLKDPEDFHRKVLELYADTEAESFDVLEFKDGRVFERYSCPQRLDGKPVGRVWTFHDITEQRNLEAQLRQVQKMDAFGQLAAGVAHDFNNILTVIHGNTSVLRSEKLTENEKAAAMAEIGQAAERAANLTRQLLTFSRRQPLQPKDLDLNEIVANITKMLQRLIGEHISLETHYASGGAPIHADPGMMEQVLINLAVNSRDAMPKGGKLILQTAVTVIGQDKVPSIHHARAGKFVCLTVRDTGGGITSEIMPHIFEPFFTTKDVGKGTGLGLATVFGIVEQHHGWINVKSKLDEGTTFQIYLPALLETAKLRPRRDIIPEMRKGTETILLVEDELPVRKLMSNLLERNGYTVHAATSGVEALKIWQDKRDDIQLLVTDMVMPGGVTGRELADRLRSEKPGIKVIYCSGYSDEALGTDSPVRSSGYFLEKPFDISAFLNKVRSCLDEK